MLDLHPHRREHVDLLHVAECLLLDGPLAVLGPRGDGDPAGRLGNYLQHLVRSSVRQLVDDVVVLGLMHVTEIIGQHRKVFLLLQLVGTLSLSRTHWLGLLINFSCIDLKLGLSREV